MLVIGMFIGALIGVLGLAIFVASGRSEVGNINDCEQCKSDLCESCDIHKRYDIVKADSKALEEENKRLVRSKYQADGRAERLQRKLDYQDRIMKVA